MGDRLIGKTAFVTGAASGIGAATAECFAGEGALVFVADVDESGAEAVASLVQGRGGRAEALRLDVSRPDDFGDALEGVARNHGSLDVLVNCAYRMVAGAIDTLSPEDWLRCMEVTLHGTFYGVSSALRIMKPQGSGAIVNFSSLCGQRGQASMGGYGAAKAAVENLTATAAIEAAPFGVRVNAVAPGAVATAGTLSVFPDGSEERAAMERLMPTGRLLDPVELAEAALFLASSGASGVNGHVLNVDSGQASQLGTPELKEGWDR